MLMTMRVLASAGLWDGHLRFILKVYLFIFITVFLAAPGLLGCMQPSPVAASRGYSFVAVLGLLMVVASLLQHRL